MAETTLFTDAGLTAYLDGELEAAERGARARARQARPGPAGTADLLKAGGRPFENAFELLLKEAPEDRLQSMLAALRIAPAEPHRRLATGFRTAASQSLWSPFSSAFLSLGSASTDRCNWTARRLAVRRRRAVRASGEWRQAVADDFALLTEAALATSRRPALRAEELETVAAMPRYRDYAATGRVSRRRKSGARRLWTTRAFRLGRLPISTPISGRWRFASCAAHEARRRSERKSGQAST